MYINDGDVRLEQWSMDLFGFIGAILELWMQSYIRFIRRISICQRTPC
jgi:hypothetical protein